LFIKLLNYLTSLVFLRLKPNHFAIQNKKLNGFAIEIKNLTVLPFEIKNLTVFYRHIFNKQHLQTAHGEKFSLFER